MSKYFGTDGFRGEANVVVTSDHAYKIGRFLGWYFSEMKRRSGSDQKAKILLGKDTRRSGYMYEYAVCAGIVSSGADACIMHVTTTPSVAYITRTDKFDCGVMISASHNPFYDNGIKLLNHLGEKMEDEVTKLCEDYLDGKLEVFGKHYNELPFATRENVGKTVDYVAGRNRYIGYLISNGIYSFSDIKVGLDCANGASWAIAKSVFDALGAQTYVINNAPDGTNINKDAGSTHIEYLQKFVVENKLDIGFAFDGDADRCLAVDELGNVMTGDNILYFCGKYLKEQGKLQKNTVVATIMSNMGLFKALDECGIEYAKTDVGDKNVYDYMKQNGCSLGGEESGHIIFFNFSTTGDGILTSLKIMEAMISSKKKASELSEGFTTFPQKLVNIRVADKDAAIYDREVQLKKDQAEKELGDKGRILLRKSGTEPVIRVMVEAETNELCDKYTSLVADEIRKQGYEEK